MVAGGIDFFAAVGDLGFVKYGDHQSQQCGWLWQLALLFECVHFIAVKPNYFGQFGAGILSMAHPSGGFAFYLAFDEWFFDIEFIAGAGGFAVFH
jgi:hypothetical protein